MFKFSSTGGSVNYRNKDEHEKMNSEIEIFQQTHGACGSFKELFEKMLEVGNRQQTVDPVEVYPENALIIGESKEDLEKFQNIVNNYRETAGLTESYSFENVICAAISCALTPEIKTEIREIPANIPENAMIIEFSDDPKRPLSRKMEILQTVQSNRQKKYNLPEPESLPSVVEKLVFSEGALFNHGGDVFTGF